MAPSGSRYAFHNPRYEHRTSELGLESQIAVNDDCSRIVRVSVRPLGEVVSHGRSGRDDQFCVLGDTAALAVNRAAVGSAEHHVIVADDFDGIWRRGVAYACVGLEVNADAVNRLHLIRRAVIVLEREGLALFATSNARQLFIYSGR